MTEIDKSYSHHRPFEQHYHGSCWEAAVGWMHRGRNASEGRSLFRLPAARLRLSPCERAVGDRKRWTGEGRAAQMIKFQSDRRCLSSRQQSPILAGGIGIANRRGDWGLSKCKQGGRLRHAFRG